MVGMYTQGECEICKGPLDVPVRQAYRRFVHRDRELCSWILNKARQAEAGIDLPKLIADQRRIGLAGIADHVARVRAEMGLPAS